ncbi:sensor histidine kinase [Streptomyces triticagri]|uniref:histidine kinase n=1 Tax=Streptomyces triticagri TaxID=2293568 RepID=A0A372MDX1_9ACTN|nr:histidine kinase [Streptomyces triticagri]RFU88705.1 sensor histidine kinase [Streptomyces triticagri]
MTTTGEEHRPAAGGPWWWQRRRSAVLDVGLAVASAIECAAEGVAFAGDAGVPTAVGVLFGLVAGSALVVRRRWPIASVLVAIAVTPANMGMLLSVVGLYSLAASEVPRRITAVLAGMSVVGTLIVTFVRTQQDAVRGDLEVGEWFVFFMAVAASLGLTAPPVLLGLYVGARRRLMESLRERADSLERELMLLADRAEERAEWARSEERTRIAREMHDVVAHRVSLMVVHAAALQAVARKDPEKAVKNAALVGDMGRQALTELREMLGVLRTEPVQSSVGVSSEEVSEESEEPSKGSSEGVVGSREVGSGEVAAPLAAVGAAAAAAASRGWPQEGSEGPWLAEVDVLVGQSRAAGMVVELSVDGEPGVYPAEVEQTAYRVIQEGLTNVHKHAAGSKAQVRLAHRGDEVAMQVENGPASEGGSYDARLPSGGNGLVGMRERVTALGGVFVAGPTDAGGFRVSAVIPASGR